MIDWTNLFNQFNLESPKMFSSTQYIKDRLKNKLKDYATDFGLEDCAGIAWTAFTMLIFMKALGLFFGLFVFVIWVVVSFIWLDPLDRVDGKGVDE